MSRADQVALLVRQWVDEEFGACDSTKAPEFLHRRVMDAVEKELIERVLYHRGGNVTRATEVLGLSRTTVTLRMDRFGLRDKREG